MFILRPQRYLTLGPAVSITKRQQSYTGVLNPGPTSLNLNVSALGADDPTRRLFIMGSGYMPGLTGVNIGGSPFDIHYYGNIYGATTLNHVIASIPYPTGTSATVNFQFSSTALKNCTFWALTVNDLVSSVAAYSQNFFTTSGVTSVSSSINQIADGITLGVGFSTNSSGSITGSMFDNFEDRWEGSNHMFAFWEATPVAATPLSVTITKVGSTSAYFGASMMTFR